MDLSTVWKLRASEGCPQHFWATCTDAQQWTALFNLNLSSSGLVSLPTAIGQLASLHVLRLNHNKLTSLPQELGQLSELEVLSVNHNQLTTLPGEPQSHKHTAWPAQAGDDQNTGAEGANLVVCCVVVLVLNPTCSCIDAPDARS